MTKQSRTADERYVLAAYHAAINTGDAHAILNRYEVGRSAGLQPKGVDSICKLLVQANFIKKEGSEDIYLTKNGEQLALRLLEEKHF